MRENGIITKVIIGLLSVAITSLFGWIWTAQTKLTTLSIQVQSIKDDKASEEKQNETLTKHWKIHSWTRHKINLLEKSANLPLSEWPDLK